MSGDANKKSVSASTRNLVTDSDVQASVIIGVGALLWKWISVASNVDFLITITNERFFVLLGWILFAAFGFIWLGVEYFRKDSKKAQSRIIKPSLLISSVMMSLLFGILLGVRSYRDGP